MTRQKFFILLMIVSIVLGFFMSKFVQCKREEILAKLDNNKVEVFEGRYLNHKINLLTNLIIAFFLILLLVISKLFRFPKRTESHIMNIMITIGGVVSVFWIVQFLRLFIVII